MRNNQATRQLCLLAAFLLIPPAAIGAAEGFPIRVTRNVARIKVGNRVVGSANVDALLWAFKLTEDKQWVSVKVPSSDQLGWLSVNDAVNLKIPDDRAEAWKRAGEFRQQWREQMDARKPLEAAKTAEDAAVEMHTILVESFGTVLPGYPPESTAWNQAGVAMMRAGRYQDAARLFDKAVAISDASLGTQHVESSVARANAAEAQVLLGNHSAAVRLFDTSLPTLEGHQSPDVHLGSFYVRYGTALVNQHRVFDARMAFEKALRAAETKSGERSLVVANIASIYATSMDQAGNRELATEQLVRALDLYREQTGPDSPRVIDTLNRLSAFHSRSNRFEEASRFAAEALEIQDEMELTEPLRLGSTQNNLGFALAKLGEFEGARTALDAAITAMAGATKDGEYITSFPLKNQAVLAVEQNDLPKARQLLGEVLAVRIKAVGPDHPGVADARVLLGEVALREEKRDEAVDLLTSAVQIQDKAQGIDHPDTRRTIQLLRNVLAGDTQGHEDLDLLIAESRERIRRTLLRPVSNSWKRPVGGVTDHQLQHLLARHPSGPVESQFTALEVTTDNAAVRSEGKTVASLRRGTIVYGFRAEGNLGSIKVPGQNVTGWISENNVRDVTYTRVSLQRLQAADKKMNDAWAIHERGNSKQAIVELRAVVATFIAELGEESPYTAMARSGLGSMLAVTGEVQAGADECAQAQRVMLDTLGENHRQTAMANNNVADALIAAGREAESLRPATAAFVIFRALGAEHKADLSLIARNIGLAMGHLSHYEASREYLEYSLKLCLEANGEKHPQTGKGYEALGHLHSAFYETDSAETAYRKAVDIFSEASGPKHPNTTKAMLGYGNALIGNQKIASGRQAIDQAADINRSERGQLDVSTIESDFARANVMKGVGNYEEAEQLLRSVVDRATEKVGADHPTVLNVRTRLAEVLYYSEEYEAALTDFEQVMASRIRSLGEHHHDSITAINGVGVCHAALGRHDKARQHYERALTLAQHVIGPDHPDTVANLFNTGEVAMLAKDYVVARPRMEAAVEAFEAQTAFVTENICVGHTTLGRLEAAQNDTRAAVLRFAGAAHRTFKLLSEVLPALSEKEQLQFLESEFRKMLDIWLSLLLTSPNNSRVAEATAEWHLNMKATSHELLSTQALLNRDDAAGGNQPLFQQLIRVREKLARMSVRSVTPDARAGHDAAVAALTVEEAKLSRQLGSDVTKLVQPRKWIDLLTLRHQIPASTTLIDFARIRHANYQMTSEADEWRPDRYVAWIIPAAGHGEVVGIDLGLADEVDTMVSQCLQSVSSRDALEAVSTEGELAATKSVQDVLTQLAFRVWRPLTPYLVSTDSIVLSPDSQLWTIPWDALPISDNTLALEQYRIRLVVSGRDLLTPRTATGDSPRVVTAPVIVADPSFDLSLARGTATKNPNQQNRLRSIETRFSNSFRNATQLPGTAVEAEAIRGSLESFAGMPPRVHLQHSAVESVVKSAQRPFCMVLSTHGFFFESANPQLGRGKLSTGDRIVENPLLRCGLLLSGCRNADSAPADADDGILTGLEIVGSDLRGTKLVVLSACETGLGAVRGGEGVAGLRQAFTLAGAESVVASLWQVDDAATAQLMDNFFQNLASGMNKSEALRQSKLTTIRARRERNGAAHPFFWAAFALTGQE